MQPRKTVLFDIIITSGRREVDQDPVANGFILMWFWLSINAVKVFASRTKKISTLVTRYMRACSH